MSYTLDIQIWYKRGFLSQSLKNWLKFRFRKKRAWLCRDWREKHWYHLGGLSHTKMQESLNKNCLKYLFKKLLNASLVTLSSKRRKCNFLWLFKRKACHTVFSSSYRMLFLFQMCLHSNAFRSKKERLFFFSLNFTSRQVN